MKFLRYGPAGQEKPGLLDDKDLPIAACIMGAEKFSRTSLNFNDRTAETGAMIPAESAVILKGGEAMPLGIARFGTQTQHVLEAAI